MMGLPLVLHIPHSATAIPDLAYPPIILDEEDLARELLRMTDWFTEQLFAVEGAAQVIFPISRLVLDPERFLDDEKETMARVGMGVIYTRTSEGHALRSEPTSAQKRDLIERFYEPHHRALAGSVDLALVQHGCALLLDCHSFPSVPLPYELDQSPERPQVCLGTDPFHTPAWLLDAAQKVFTARNLTVAVDRPFSGALGPPKHHWQDKRLLALMIELNRSTYMDESTAHPLESFDPLRSLLHEAVLEAPGCMPLAPQSGQMIRNLKDIPSLKSIYSQ